MKKFFAALLIIFTIVISASNINAYCSEDNSNQEKTIYLTFDDGPGAKVTEQVLDILKEENVNATFFLIGDQFESQEDLLKRIVDEGNAVGLHSMSHCKSKLYSSDDAFIEEMLKEQQILEDITGVKTYLVRFPFGCNNTCYHLKHSLVDKLHEQNFKIYDWNADSTDGANHNASPDTLLKHAKSDKDTVYLLMHCGFMNKNSAKALPSIIKYYKDNNYTFKVIDENTDEIFHYMKK